MQKKMTRDQAIIKLLTEDTEKQARLEALKKDKESLEKRVRALEAEMASMKRLLAQFERRTKVIKETSSRLDSELSTVKNQMVTKNQLRRTS